MPLGFSPPFFLSVSFLIFSLDRFAIACLLKHLRGYNAHSTASTIPECPGGEHGPANRGAESRERYDPRSAGAYHDRRQ